MPVELPADPIWAALSTSHQQLAQVFGRARRYPAAIAPFAAMDPTLGQSDGPRAGDTRALEDLYQLLQPGEEIYLAGLNSHQLDELQAFSGLRAAGAIPCLQMIFPRQAPLPDIPGGNVVEPLSCDNAGEMLDLLAIAYPGFFKKETCRMGRYFGIRDGNKRLIAMGGERLCLHPWREVSRLCSHPDHAGRGLGTAVLREILATHREEGSSSWLWVTESNTGATALYRRLGWQTIRRTELQRVCRTGE